MAKEYKDLVVGLDIGTAKVMAVVAEVLPDGELHLAGLGIAGAHGLKRGVVVNIDATVQSIQQALKEAEMMAYCKITRVYTGITGSHIRGQNSTTRLTTLLPPWRTRFASSARLGHASRISTTNGTPLRRASNQPEASRGNAGAVTRMTSKEPVETPRTAATAAVNS